MHESQRDGAHDISFFTYWMKLVGESKGPTDKWVPNIPHPPYTHPLRSLTYLLGHTEQLENFRPSATEHEFEPQLSCLLAMWCWASYLTSLHLCPLSYTTGLLWHLTPGLWKGLNEQRLVKLPAQCSAQTRGSILRPFLGWGLGPYFLLHDIILKGTNPFPISFPDRPPSWSRPDHTRPCLQFTPCFICMRLLSWLP